MHVKINLSLFYTLITTIGLIVISAIKNIYNHFYDELYFIFCSLFYIFIYVLKTMYHICVVQH